MSAQLTTQERQDVQHARELVEDIRARVQGELEDYFGRLGHTRREDAAIDRLERLMDDCQTVIDAITTLEKDN